MCSSMACGIFAKSSYPAVSARRLIGLLTTGGMQLQLYLHTPVFRLQTDASKQTSLLITWCNIWLKFNSATVITPVSRDHLLCWVLSPRRQFSHIMNIGCRNHLFVLSVRLWTFFLLSHVILLPDCTWLLLDQSYCQRSIRLRCTTLNLWLAPANIHWK